MVLLADDERLELDMLRDHIGWTRMGLTLAGAARNGAEAWTLYEEKRPDIVVTDIKMPVMDGLELTRRIRTADAAAPIVIISGHDDFLFAKHALRLGVTDYVLKPILIDEFEPLMESLANKTRARKEQARRLEAALLAATREDMNVEILLEDLLANDPPALLARFEVFTGLLAQNAILLEPCRRACGMLLKGIYDCLRSRSQILTDALVEETLRVLEGAACAENMLGILEKFFRRLRGLLSEKRNPAMYQARRVQLALEEMYSQPVSMRELARRLHLSEGYARNVFRRHMGETALDYLTRVRIEKAKELLNNPVNPIYKVGEQVGIENPSYFCALFRKYTGVTPNEYRKR
jgi:two-component system response regulator YesN